MASPAFQVIPAALHSRNYRLFFFGQTVSMIGTWMTQVTNAWLVYHLTHSALLLGIVGFASQVPVFIFAPFAGVFVDRWDRHRILLITQCLAMLQSFALATLTLTNQVSIQHLLVLVLLQGCINSVDIPTRQTFVIEMVNRREDLGSAIALNSSLISMARLTGPAIAGVMIGVLGAGWCYLADGISYLAVLCALLAMHLNPRIPSATQDNALQKLKEGFRYAFGSPPIRAVLLLLTLFSFMIISYMALGPIFATEILKGGPQTLGLLLSASGVGALTGGLYMSTRQGVVGLERILSLASALAGVGLIAFGFSHTLWLSQLILIGVGFCFVLLISSSNTILQTIVDNDKRGRVMSLYTMAFVGTAPFGNLFAGTLASRIGAPHTVMFCGFCCIIGSLVFLRQRSVLKPYLSAQYDATKG